MNYCNADGDLTIEVDPDNGVLRLRAVATFDDPVDLTPDEARELAQQLLRLADEV